MSIPKDRRYVLTRVDGRTPTTSLRNQGCFERYMQRYLPNFQHTTPIAPGWETFQAVDDVASTESCTP